MSVQRPHIEPGRLFIGGEWRDAESKERRDVIDPSTGKVVTTVADADGTDLAAAVAAARDAFDAGPWPRTPARERARVLHRVADLVRERADEIAAVESLDVGKPVSFSRGWTWRPWPRRTSTTRRWRRASTGPRGSSPYPPTPTPAGSPSAWWERSPRSTSR